jgi:hypothetical protein
MYSQPSTDQYFSKGLVRRSLYVPHTYYSDRLLLAFHFMLLTVIASSLAIAAVARMALPRGDVVHRAALHYLESRQYAFALPRLTQLANERPYDGPLQLSLARAYIGLDQDVRAWIAIEKAKKLGLQVTSDPQLAGELARRRIQRNEFNAAVEVLKPLAKKGDVKTKLLMADYLSAWGDFSFRNSDYQNAKKRWIQARDLRGTIVSGNF